MRAARIGLVAGCLLLGACGDRPDAWGTQADDVRTVGLEGSVALVDNTAHRVVVATPTAELQLGRRSVPVGKGVVNAVPSTDRKKLFVLATGDVPRKKAEDEGPSLTIIDDGGAASRRIELQTPLSGITIDPAGRWVVVYPAGDGKTFVENPNQLVLVDLEAPAERAVRFRTIRSFGGKPQRITFTKELTLPAGPRHLLVVETDQDVALLDLDHVQDPVERKEITVRLTSGQSARVLKPGGVVTDDGEPDQKDDARIALRLDNDSNVVILTLGPNPLVGPDAPNDFKPSVNLVDVGGSATDIAFVRTDGGLRLAALVPGARRAVLIEPATSITTPVDLPDAYAKVSLVTDLVLAAGDCPAGAGDVALLYSGGLSVAFWSLGKTSGQPYRSVEVVNVAGGAADVTSVPQPNQSLKILSSTTGTGFFVLDLKSRTAAPLTTQRSSKVMVSPDGQRLWAFAPGTENLAHIPVSDLAPLPLPLDRPIREVFDVRRTDGGRALVAVDARGTVGLTVLDGQAPDVRRANSFYGLLLEDL